MRTLAAAMLLVVGLKGVSAAALGGPTVLNVAALGDSQTDLARRGEKSPAGWSMRGYLGFIQPLLGSDAKVSPKLVCAKGGYRTDQVLALLLPKCLSLKPDVLIVLVGGNDIAQRVPASRVIRNIDAIYSAAHNNRTPLVAVSVLPKGPQRKLPADQAKEILFINRWMRSRAMRSKGIAYVDAYAALAGTRTYEGNPTYYLEDGVHLSPAGAKALATAIAPAVLALAVRR